MGRTSNRVMAGRRMLEVAEKLGALFLGGCPA
jgi:hypothetical protein